MAEDNVDYEQKGQEILTPKKRVMGEARGVILGPLEKLGLSEDEIEAIGKYADKVGDLAGQEFDRLQTESPVRQILAAMEEHFPGGDEQSEWREDRMRSFARLPKKWQDAVLGEQSLALLQGQSIKPEVIIEQLWNAARQGRDYEKFPTTAAVFEITNSNQKGLLAQFLIELGVLHEGTDVDTLYKLPSKDWTYANSIEIDKASREGIPTRIDEKTIIGLKSDRLPGVAFQVNQSYIRYNNYSVEPILTLKLSLVAFPVLWE